VTLHNMALAICAIAPVVMIGALVLAFRRKR
jgi:hypothetical protein